MSEILNKFDYRVLQDADIFLGGDVARVLNANGRANWTVCPECRVDDFTHVEGCTMIPHESSNAKLSRAP